MVICYTARDNEYTCQYGLELKFANEKIQNARGVVLDPVVLQTPP